MLLNILVGILAVIGGIVVFIVLALLILYFVLARRMRRRVRQLLNRFDEDHTDGVIDSDDYHEWDSPDFEPDIPRFSVELVPNEHFEWWDPELVEKVSVRLTKGGFKKVGDYVVEHEDDSAKRFFLGDDGRIIAILHQDQHMEEEYLEFFFEMVSGGRGGVGNPPNCTIDLPEGVVGKHFGPQLSEGLGIITKMLVETRKLIAKHPAKRWQAQDVSARFERAYNEDMLWRVRLGGVSEKEILRTLEMQGMEADKETIGSVQESWQDAIEDFLIEQSRRAVEHDEEGREILAVHDGSLKDYLVMRLSDFLLGAIDEDSAEAEQKLGELKQLLNRFSPREAIARFRPLLPRAIRFDLIEQLKLPVETDFYVLP